MASTTAS